MIRRLLVLVVLLMACATTKPTPAASSKAPPPWVTAGSGVVDGEPAVRAFVGVGVASGTDIITRHQKAESEARNELDKVLKVYATSMARQAGGPAVGADDLQKMEAQFDTALHGESENAAITSYWVAPDGTEYALASCSYNAATGVMLGAASLSMPQHLAFTSGAEAAFKALVSPPPTPEEKK